MMTEGMKVVKDFQQSSLIFGLMLTLNINISKVVLYNGGIFEISMNGWLNFYEKRFYEAIIEITQKTGLDCK